MIEPRSRTEPTNPGMDRTRPSRWVTIQRCPHSAARCWSTGSSIRRSPISITAPSARRRGACCEKQQALRDEMERQPSRFVLRELNAAAADAVAAASRGCARRSGRSRRFVGARPDDLVFVPNVTTGLNAVLRSVPLGSRRRGRDLRSGVWRASRWPPAWSRASGVRPFASSRCRIRCAMPATSSTRS